MPSTLTLSRPGRLVGATLLLIMSTCVLAGQMYRYEDEDGSTVMSSTLPQEAAKRGYEILNQSGRVIEEVPPAPTDEEIAEMEREQEEQSRREAEEERQREIDEQLMRQYSSPDDVVRALQRNLREMFSAIRLEQGNITSAENQLAEEESQAANLERAGEEVPDSVHENMERLREEIDSIEEEIAEKMKDVEAVREEYRERIERMEELTEEERTLPLTIPEEEEAREHMEEMEDE